MVWELWPQVPMWKKFCCAPVYQAAELTGADWGGSSETYPIPVSPHYYSTDQNGYSQIQ